MSVTASRDPETMLLVVIEYTHQSDVGPIMTRIDTT